MDSFLARPSTTTNQSNQSTPPFKDRLYAVTGAGQGIGLATARMLLARGARVSIGDLDESALEIAKKTFKNEGTDDRTLVKKLDVTDKDSVDGWIRETVEWGGRTLDGAVNVAGVNGPETGKPLAETSDAHFDAVMKVNLYGMFHSLRAELNNIKSPGGSIICVSSVQGMIGNDNTATYSASKHAIIGLVRSVAKEVGKKGVRVNTVAPGAIDTRMVAPQHRENISTPIARLGTPDECAHLIAFLLSDEAGFITGATYLIDGGWTS